MAIMGRYHRAPGPNLGIPCMGERRGGVGNLGTGDGLYSIFLLFRLVVVCSGWSLSVF